MSLVFFDMYSDRIIVLMILEGPGLMHGRAIYYSKKIQGAMLMTRSITKNEVQRQVWLLYFNRVLFEKGVITEKEYRQMIIKIQTHK